MAAISQEGLAMPRRTNRRTRPTPPSAVTPADRSGQRPQPPIVPNDFRHQAEVPDAVPAVVAVYSWSEDQLLLAKVRHNRLLDLALGVVSYSLGSVHGAEVPGAGPVDVEELYVGVRDFGGPLVVPILVQRPEKLINAPRLRQVEAFCQHYYCGLPVRLMAAQLKWDEVNVVVVLFDLVRRGDSVKLRDEKQYRIVSASRVR